MLVNLNFLKKAQKEHFAIGGFNITALETALAIVEAAEEEKSPVILQISEKTIDYMSLEVAFAISKTLADKAKVPVAIHFDHGKNFPLVEQALKIGFPSVMLDVSSLGKANRIPFVKKFVKLAHRMGATVEVEEDAIGGKEDYVTGGVTLTDPKRAEQFVRETECDAFAVAIGSVHGKPMPNEHLYFDLLSEIRAEVKVPLVLHGASSTPPEKIREAIKLGICKFNIDTDLRVAFTNGLRKALKEGDLYDPRDELTVAKDEVKKVVKEKIKLFGSSGK